MLGGATRASRLTGGLLATIAAFLSCACAAQATLVYERLGHGPGQSVVVAARDDGSDAHVIAHNADGPALSPDGRWVLYYAGRTRETRLVSTRGGRSVSVSAPNVYGPVWAPNSRRFALSGYSATGNTVTLGSLLHGKARERAIHLNDNENQAEAVFSPDSADALVADGDYETFPVDVFDVHGSRIRRVSACDLPQLWTPAGLFNVRGDDTKFDPGTYSALTIATRFCGRDRTLIKAAADALTLVAATPDGARILLQEDLYEPVRHRYPVVYDLRSGESHVVHADVQPYAISRDGQHILASDGEGRLIAVALDGTSVTLAPRGTEASWSR